MEASICLILSVSKTVICLVDNRWLFWAFPRHVLPSCLPYTYYMAPKYLFSLLNFYTKTIIYVDINMSCEFSWNELEVFTARNDHVKGKYSLGGLTLSDRIILKSVKRACPFVYSNGHSVFLRTSSLIFWATTSFSKTNPVYPYIETAGTIHC